MFHRILLLLLVITFSSCSYVKNYFNIRKKSIEFTETLLANDYAKCVSLMPVDFYEGISLDSTHIQILELKKQIDSKLGKNLKATFLGTINSSTYSPNPKIKPTVYEFGIVQISNDSCYGNFEIRFDKESGKVDNINLSFIKTVPDTSNLYIFGILALLVLFFNLYTIWKLMKSSITRKWIWIIVIIILNCPSLVFSFATGLEINWIGFIPFLGMNYSFYDWDSMAIIIGLPIGAIWVWYKLSTFQSKQIEDNDIDDLQTQIN